MSETYAVFVLEGSDGPKFVGHAYSSKNPGKTYAVKISLENLEKLTDDILHSGKDGKGKPLHVIQTDAHSVEELQRKFPWLPKDDIVTIGTKNNFASDCVAEIVASVDL
mgnify:CR=1 FL=1